MSTIRSTNNVGIYKIQKFLGLNEAPDGDSLLKLGEASSCRNWMITRDRNLKRRPGTHTVYTLANNAPVQGLWYGNINGVRTGLAACNGHLYKFFDEFDYLETPYDLGEFDTTGRVNFFAYNNIVYILNGDEYMQYDGVSFKAVTGYVPIVAVSRTPNGSSSTLLEEVNKLSPMRKVWFSPDGEDNVFLLPEKDILSVHYVKNLSSGEYIDPSEYNVNRITGTVTFGKDAEIVYDGINTSYEITDDDINAVGSVLINGAVPQTTYLSDRSGIVFDEPPKYGQIVKMITGTEFEEEFVGDGETSEFELANKGMASYDVSIDGDQKNIEPLFENHFMSGQRKSFLAMKYSLETDDYYEIVSEEDAEFTKTVTVAANHDSVALQKDSWFGNNMPYKVTVKYETSGEELPQIEGVEASLCPYPEALDIDTDAFTEAYRDIIGLTVGQNEAYFYYHAQEDKWKISDGPYGWRTHSSTFTLGNGSAPLYQRVFTYTSVSQAMDNLVFHGITIHAQSSGYGELLLLEGRDYNVQLDTTQTGRTRWTFTLKKNVSDYYENIYQSIPSAVLVSLVGGFTPDNIGLPYLVDLSDYGITYSPEMPPDDGDILVVQFICNFLYDGTTLTIKPHNSVVTAQTKFLATQHDKRTNRIKFAYAPNNFSDETTQYNRIYYLNSYDPTSTTALSGMTGSTLLSFEFYVNGRRYYEEGDFSISSGKIVFTETPAEGALIHINEIHDVVEKSFGADGETAEFSIGYFGAKLIEVSLDDVDVTLDRRFLYDPYTKVVTIIDTENMTAGDVITVKGANPPPRGLNTIEICYSAGMAFQQSVNKMTNAEVFLGVQDNAVFLYGDGSNKAFYSGIDYNGKPRADYFPDLNEMAVADTNTPITGMVRHYSKLLCFKSGSAYSVQYGIISTATGANEFGFYITPINKRIGNSALGQVQLILNSPYTLFGNELYEWKNTSSYSSNLSIDERQAKRISDRIHATLKDFDMSKCYCYDDNDNQEYYIWCDDKALVYNYAVDAWYQYAGIAVNAMCNLEDDVLLGTSDGRICKLSDEYLNDDGEAFDCYWESGSMDFGSAYMRKLMSEVWVSMKPEGDYSVRLTAMTDKKLAFTEKEITGTATNNETPIVKKLKIKAKKFAYLKLILKADQVDKAATVLAIDPKVRETGYAK